MIASFTTSLDPNLGITRVFLELSSIVMSYMVVIPLLGRPETRTRSHVYGNGMESKGVERDFGSNCSWLEIDGHGKWNGALYLERRDFGTKVRIWCFLLCLLVVVVGVDEVQ